MGHYTNFYFLVCVLNSQYWKILIHIYGRLKNEYWQETGNFNYHVYNKVHSFYR